MPEASRKGNFEHNSEVIKKLYDFFNKKDNAKSSEKKSKKETVNVLKKATSNTKTTKTPNAKEKNEAHKALKKETPKQNKHQEAPKQNKHQEAPKQNKHQEAPKQNKHQEAPNVLKKATSNTKTTKTPNAKEKNEAHKVLKKETPKQNKHQEAPKVVVEKVVFDTKAKHELPNAELKKEAHKPSQHQEEFNELLPKQKQSVFTIDLDDSDVVAKINPDTIMTLREGLLIAGLTPLVQVGYCPDPNKQKKDIIIDALKTTHYFLTKIRKWMFLEVRDQKNSINEHIKKIGLSSEKFFDIIFDTPRCFFPLGQKYKLFLDGMIKEVFEIEGMDIPSSFMLLEKTLEYLKELQDPLVVFENPDTLFLETKIRDGVFDEKIFIKNEANKTIYKKFEERCRALLLDCAKKESPKEEKQLQDKMKMLAESTMLDSVRGGGSFYGKMQKIVPLMPFFISPNLKKLWIEVREMLFKDSELKVVAIGKKNLSEFAFSESMNRALQNRCEDSFFVYNNSTLPQDRDVAQHIMLAILINGLSNKDVCSESLKDFLAKLTKQDKLKIVNTKIKLMQDFFSGMIPLPVLFYFCTKTGHFLHIIRSLGLDVFNVKFKFNEKECDIISFVKRLGDCYRKEREEVPLDAEEEEMYKEILSERIDGVCAELEKIKTKLKLDAEHGKKEIVEEITRKNQTIKASTKESKTSEETSNVKIIVPSEHLGSSVDKETGEEKEPKQDTTTTPDTKIDVTQLEPKETPDAKIRIVVPSEHLGSSVDKETGEEKEPKQDTTTTPDTKVDVTQSDFHFQDKGQRMSAQI